MTPRVRDRIMLIMIIVPPVARSQSNSKILHLLESAIGSPVFTVAGLLDGRQGTVGIRVAAAGTVPQFADGIFGVPVLLVGPWLVIARVATGAIRFIRGVRPRYGLAVARMTRQTGRIPGMVARIAPRRVGKTDGCPGSRVVAGIALQ